MTNAPSTILVVDDYSDNRTLLSAWLRATVMAVACRRARAPTTTREWRDRSAS